VCSVHSGHDGARTNGHVAQFAVEGIGAVNFNNSAISFVTLIGRDVVVWGQGGTFDCGLCVYEA
jgi:hypothetical protein